MIGAIRGESVMGARGLVLASAILVSAASAAAADEIEVIARDLRFPEGPLWSDGALWLVEYGGHTILKLEDGKPVTVWQQDGCGPAALARVAEGLLVTCYDAGTLVVVAPDGRTLRTYDRDAQGEAMVGPNDLVADASGGLYITASGPWETAPIVGKILYRAPDGELRTVADDLHYPNGVALSPDGKTLYCSETYAYRIVAFDVGADGSLSGRRQLARLSAIAGEPGDTLLGPDGLKTDAAGNLYIALYEGGKVLVASPEGKLLATIDPPAGWVSNVAFGRDEGELIITGVLDGNNAPWPGEVYRVANPLRP